MQKKEPFSPHFRLKMAPFLPYLEVWQWRKKAVKTVALIACDTAHCGKSFAYAASLPPNLRGHESFMVSMRGLKIA